MKRTAALLAALTMAVTGVGLAATTATAAPGAAVAACPTGWGSLQKSAASTGFAPLTNARTGQHDCYDRLVFDAPGGGNVGYLVRYVDEIRQDPTGVVIPVKGGAILEVVVMAPSYDPMTGKVTWPGIRAGQPLPGTDVSGYTTFRDTRFASTFEGQTQVGLGVRARLPFRVQQLADKVVVDVAHTW